MRKSSKHFFEATKISSTKNRVEVGVGEMPRRNTRSNKDNKKGLIDLDYLHDKYCSPTPPKRSRSSPHTPKPSAATTRNGRGSGGGDAVSHKGASKFNVSEIARQVNGNIEKQFVQRVLDEMFMPSTKTMLK